MDWNCVETDKRLSDYLERVMTPEETAAFSAHLEGCPDCAALVARVGGAMKMLHSAPAPEVPPYLFKKIINATSGKQPVERGWRRWLRPAAIAWQPQFAMGAITIAASFLIVFHAANTSHDQQNLAMLNPINLVRAANRQAHLTYAHTAKFVNDIRLVYEIESRFEPDEDQESAPSATPPAQTPSATPQPSEPQPKSEAAPRSGIRTTRSHGLYALASASSEHGPAAQSDSAIDPEQPEEWHFSLANDFTTATPDDIDLSATRSHT
jgi:anti-sigma factor RsiW